jgi:hypothetical protein
MSKPKNRVRAVPTFDHDHAPAERWQRGVEFELVEPEPDAGHKVQRIASGLHQLEKRGRIQPCHTVAALRYRRDFELGIEGARDPERTGSGARSHDGAMIARVDAVSRYRCAADAVGPDADALLRLYVVYGLSLRAISADSRFDRRGLADGLAESLEGLAEHYRRSDIAHRTPHA